MKPNLPIGGSGVNKARYKQDRAGDHKSSTKAKRTSLLVRFASDSPVEGDGFELPVPREKKSRNLGIPLEFTDLVWLRPPEGLGALAPRVEEFGDVGSCYLLLTINKGTV